MRCYTGLECRGDILRFNPAFPEEMEDLTMQVRYRGQWLELDISKGSFGVRALSGGAGTIKIEVGGEVLELREGEAAKVPLRAGAAYAEPAEPAGGTRGT
ncbi:MAG: glycosyl hydrolase family 65 protein [Actinomycetota bacterium]|nr:glycosyl hydrolase family 65 protein [Actinomycetota bacterium]